MTHSKLTRAGLTLGVVFTLAASVSMLVSASARADEIDDYTHKLIDLDQRVRVMAQEFREAPPPPADIADRRVLDAQVLFGLKNYQEARPSCWTSSRSTPTRAPTTTVCSCWASRCSRATTRTRRGTTSSCSCSARRARSASRRRCSV
jgi:hypothetical protein